MSNQQPILQHLQWRRSKFSNTLEHPHISNQFKKMHKNKGGDRGRQMGRKNQKPETKDQELDSNDLRMDMREISKRIELLGLSWHLVNL
ncbi:hypothetical protein ABKV19_016488 [Rosa sericea]